MTRQKDTAHKEELLEAAMGYVLLHGFSGLSLRPLADGIGTSARMLIHHFGSKEALMGLIVERIEAQFLSLSDQLLEETGDPTRMLQGLWNAFTQPDTDAFQRSTFELWGYALMNPAGLEQLTENLASAWVARFTLGFRQAGLKKSRAETLASLTVATIHGLLLQRLTVRHDAHTHAAFKQFTQWLGEEVAR
jgi:AcrR family transcriptional regulator